MATTTEIYFSSTTIAYFDNLFVSLDWITVLLTILVALALVDFLRRLFAKSRYDGKI